MFSSRTVYVLKLLHVAEGDQQQAPAVPMIMPAERAKAVFDDARVQTFLRMIKDNFAASYTLPDADKTQAKVKTQVDGGPALVSYEITIPCSGGVRAIRITAEFVPPDATPNLSLSFDLKQ